MTDKEKEIVQVQEGAQQLSAEQATQAGNPMALLATAIQKGDLPIEHMERLMAMQERWEERQAKKAFDAALAKFQGICPVIKKEKTAHGKYTYKYSSLDNIVEQIKESLAECDLSYQFKTICDREKAEVTSRCHVTHIDGHTEISEFTVPLDGGSMSNIQKFGSSRTYANRYSLSDGLGIVTADDDTDATPAAMGEDQPQQKQDQKPVQWEDQGHGLCERCGAANAVSKKGSAYCSAICWEMSDVELQQHISKGPHAAQTDADEQPAPPEYIDATTCDKIKSLVQQKGSTLATLERQIKRPIDQLTTGNVHSVIKQLEALPDKKPTPPPTKTKPTVRDAETEPKVIHEDTCAIHNGGECDCIPTTV
jgi:hypothetical protein